MKKVQNGPVEVCLRFRYYLSALIVSTGRPLSVDDARGVGVNRAKWTGIFL